MPLMILLQCSYETKDLELQMILNVWLNLRFILWQKKRFSVLFPDVFLVFYVVFDCYNTLSWGFHRNICCNPQVLRHNDQHCAHHFTCEVHSIVPSMWRKTFVHTKFHLLFHCSDIHPCNVAQQDWVACNTMVDEATNKRVKGRRDIPHVSECFWILTLLTLWVNEGAVSPCLSRA